MKNWESALISPDASLRNALKVIDALGTQFAMVVDSNRRLLGTLSDGDARRALLNGFAMDDSVERIMHTGATVINSSTSPLEIQATMRRTGCHQLPIVDAEGVVVGLTLMNDFLKSNQRDNWVIIMAGGLGTRLQELTRETPKPMLKVGTRPLLETIISNFADQGFKRFYLAVNYKAEQIEAHFGNGSTLGVDIRYIREKQRMGTAGALSLLEERPTSPFIVTNGDLLTKDDFSQMMDHHIDSGAQATMAVRHYEIQVPFGVVRLHNGAIERIEEKPVQQYLISAGVYALSPEVLNLLPPGQFFDMPGLFDKLLKVGMHTRAHQIDGYWMDIGRLHDFERANTEFNDIFN